MDQAVQDWVTRSDGHLGSARVLTDAGHATGAYIWCQLAIELRIKAIIMQQTGELAPRIRDLMVLARRASLETDEDRERAIDRINTLYVCTVYPGEGPVDSAVESAEVAADTVARTEEVIAWLDQWLK